MGRLLSLKRLLELGRAGRLRLSVSDAAPWRTQAPEHESRHRALGRDEGSTKVLQQATACRGALDGFIAEVIEDHIREQVVDADDKVSARFAAEELIGIVHSYLT